MFIHQSRWRTPLFSLFLVWMRLQLTLFWRIWDNIYFVSSSRFYSFGTYLYIVPSLPCSCVDFSWIWILFGTETYNFEVILHVKYCRLKVVDSFCMAIIILIFTFSFFDKTNEDIIPNVNLPPQRVFNWKCNRLRDCFMMALTL